MNYLLIHKIELEERERKKVGSYGNRAVTQLLAASPPRCHSIIKRNCKQNCERLKTHSSKVLLMWTLFYYRY